MSDIQKAIGQNSNKWTAYDVQFTNKSFIGNGNRRKSRKKNISGHAASIRFGFVRLRSRL